MTLTPTLLTRGSYFPWTRILAASLSPGLDSAGYVSLPDTTSDSDGILQVFTVQQCQRELSVLPWSVVVRLNWTGLDRNYDICYAAPFLVIQGMRKNLQEKHKVPPILVEMKALPVGVMLK
jgi:hypothetical protein